MRDKTLLFAIPAIILLVLGNLFLTPYLHQREVTRIVTAVLEGWESGAIPETYEYWEDPNNAPPAYNLLSYQINKKIMDKGEDGRRHAQVFVTIEFSAGNVLPSGKEWIFELRQTKFGWKIKNFSAASGAASPAQ